MAHPNEDLVRRVFDAYSRGDIQALLTDVSPGVVWHVPGRGPLAGDHAGLEAVRAHFARVAGLSGSTHRVELHDVIGNDDHVVALHAARAERGGKRLDLNALHLFHVRDGMITEVRAVHLICTRGTASGPSPPGPHQAAWPDMTAQPALRGPPAWLRTARRAAR